MKDVNKDGTLGKSKGFGFVSFSRHEHALKALRKLNNNPKIFKADRRPIVEFAIENLSALKKRVLNTGRSTQDYLCAPFLTNYKEENYPYMGLKARPFREKEIIRPPKVNRKVIEKLKALKKQKIKKKGKKKKPLKRIGRT